MTWPSNISDSVTVDPRNVGFDGTYEIDYESPIGYERRQAQIA